MSRITSLMPGIWYNSVKDKKEIDLIKESLTRINSEKECILSIVEMLKAGDFSIKQLLVQLMNSTKDDEVLNLCIRVFCSISTHKDLKNSDNLAFLSNTSDFGAFTFASSAPSTLSYDVVPYLLAMLEDWEDTYVEQPLKDSLDTILNYSARLNIDADVNEIGQLFIEDMKNINKEIYYYKQKPVFPGELTKELIEQSYVSLKTSTEVKMHIIPSLLSNWSGIKCPVEYNTVMDNKIFEILKEYIDKLVKIPWKKGEKYFYSYEI